MIRKRAAQFRGHSGDVFFARNTEIDPEFGVLRGQCSGTAAPLLRPGGQAIAMADAAREDLMDMRVSVV